jgi:hypothetical protein
MMQGHRGRTKSLSLSLYKRERLLFYYVSPFVKGD